MRRGVRQWQVTFELANEAETLCVHIFHAIAVANRTKYELEINDSALMASRHVLMRLNPEEWLEVIIIIRRQ